MYINIIKYHYQILQYTSFKKGKFLRNQNTIITFKCIDINSVI